MTATSSSRRHLPLPAYHLPPPPILSPLPTCRCRAPPALRPPTTCHAGNLVIGGDESSMFVVMGGSVGEQMKNVEREWVNNFMFEPRWAWTWGDSVAEGRKA